MSTNIGFIYAHPDDETFLSACLIKSLADNGERPVLLLATRGDAGKKNGDVAHLTNDELAAMRTEEMDTAARILGLNHVEHLGYPDGKLNMMDQEKFVDEVVSFINRHELKIVFTFPEDGGNFHPDHMTISKITAEAVHSGRCPSVQKMYYSISDTLRAQGRTPSVHIDTRPSWELKAAALKAHQSQIFAIARYFGDLSACPENRRYESFVLAWERGTLWPVKQERSIMADLL
ncbi:PIG-L deacetylase family protein [Paenibacillus xerothermodurans]|uniref:PIG-L family deacetylase n=1 Tax=Paenibacillus xerothermodurans TaxID=1977292 RepID=A0A2W1NGX3_PAEXE|nr:PIG-L family deacetylase [Paenibacillus xerothermodurans]PZE22361.1 PIG-L family deacetylase [Paenibacillus xerothermodurans]